jgi:hypothetical protein
MLAKTSQADVWMAVGTIATAVIALAALALSAINFFAKRKDKEATRQWQAAAEQREQERDERDRQREERERERARREVADRVWITLEYVGMAEARSPTLVCFEVHVHNHAGRPIYDLRIEKMRAIAHAIDFTDGLNSLSMLRDVERVHPLVPPQLWPQDAPVMLPLNVPGDFDDRRGGLHRPQDKVHAVVEVSFSDGVTRWLVDSAGAPPRELP